MFQVVFIFFSITILSPSFHTAHGDNKRCDGLSCQSTRERRALDSTDPKCNSDRLRKVIHTASGQDTPSIKRSIQLMAEQRLDAKFNVICAEEDFSYITNTEEFCQDVVGGKTCYVFKQYNRVASASASSLNRKKMRKFRRRFHHH